MAAKKLKNQERCTRASRIFQSESKRKRFHKTSCCSPGTCARLQRDSSLGRSLPLGFWAPSETIRVSYDHVQLCLKLRTCHHEPTAQSHVWVVKTLLRTETETEPRSSVTAAVLVRLYRNDPSPYTVVVVVGKQTWHTNPNPDTPSASWFVPGLFPPPPFADLLQLCAARLHRCSCFAAVAHCCALINAFFLFLIYSRLFCALQHGTSLTNQVLLSFFTIVSKSALNLCSSGSSSCRWTVLIVFYRAGKIRLNFL